MMIRLFLGRHRYSPTHPTDSSDAHQWLPSGCCCSHEPRLIDIILSYIMYALRLYGSALNESCSLIYNVHNTMLKKSRNEGGASD